MSGWGSRGKPRVDAAFPAGDPRFREYTVSVRGIDGGPLAIRVVECGAVVTVAPSPADEIAPVVCVHGWGCSAFTFHDVLLGVAARGRRAIAFDLPGHGRSTIPPGEAAYTLDAFAAVTGAVLDALGAVRAVLVGHSMGGAIAARVASIAPDRVVRLVLAAPAGFVVPRRLAMGRWLVPRWLAPYLPRLLRRWVVRVVLRRVFGTRHRPPPQDTDEYWVFTRSSAFARAMRTILQVFAWDAGASCFAGIRSPTVLLSGGEDIILPSAVRDGYVATLPDIESVMLPECGHVIPEEEPDAVVRAALGVHGVTFRH